MKVPSLCENVGSFWLQKSRDSSRVEGINSHVYSPHLLDICSMNSIFLLEGSVLAPGAPLPIISHKYAIFSIKLSGGHQCWSQWFHFKRREDSQGDIQELSVKPSSVI